MSDVRYPVPAFDGPGLQTGSRLLGGLGVYTVAPRMAVQVAGATNQGGTVVPPTPFDWETQPKSRLYLKLTTSNSFSGAVTFDLTIDYATAGAFVPLARVVKQTPEPHSPEQALLGPRTFFPKPYTTGVTSLDLTIDYATAGAYTPLANVVKQPREAHSPEQTLLGPRSFLPVPRATGSASLDLTIDYVTDGVFTARTIAKTLRATQPFTYEDPQPASRMFSGLAGQYSGSLSHDLTIGYDTTGSVPGAAGPRIGVAQAGSNNQGFQTKQPVPEGQDTPLLESRAFLYYNSAPPIYRVILPGGTNQGFQFQAIPRVPVEVPPSRLFKSISSVGGAASLDLTIDYATGGAFVPRTPVNRGIDPFDYPQRLLDSRLFSIRPFTSGSVDFPIVINYDTTGSGGVAVNPTVRTLLGVGR